MGLVRRRPGKHGLLIALLFALCSMSGCKQRSWPLWKAYEARFLSSDGRVIDRTAGGCTTSEGQAYALFFALVDNDRTTFDRLLRWTQVNLAGGDLATRLPGRMWGQAKDGQWELLDPHSSADADVWMAYTLIEAGRLWNAPAYTSLGRAMMAQIAKSEVADLAGFGPMLLPGPGGVRQQQTLTLSPASMPLFVFQRFAAIDPAGPWGQVAANFPAMLAESARHGFAMDRVNYIPGDGFSPAAPIETVNNASETPGGSRDAMRVYLWAGMIDRGSPVRAQVLNAIPAMNAYLAKHDAPPQNVSDQGIPLAQDGPVGFSAAVLPYLRAFPGSSRQSARQTVRIGRMRDPSTGLYGKDLATYDQILVLFATGFIDGRFRFGMGGELNVDWTR